MPQSPTSKTTSTWRRLLVSYIAGHPDRPLKTRALARELNITSSDYTGFRAFVRDLLADGTLVLGPGRTLRLPDQTGLIVGTFRAHPRGFGFIERGVKPDLYVPGTRTRGAVEGDRVAAREIRARGRMPGPRAEVVRILERAPQKWVGVLERAGAAWVVYPQGREPLPVAEIVDPTAHGAQPGDLVVVVPQEYEPGVENVMAKIVERLGDPEDAHAQVSGVLRRFGIQEEFPAEVKQASRRAASQFRAGSDPERRDLQSLTTVTIDPPDARDFDDAISVQPLRDGRVRLGVHIADVAYFVPADGAIDQEALRRGTSVYFPDRAVPMLPEALSNETCSLQPDQPRFTKTVFLDYDREGRIVDANLCNSVIRSRARLTYEQVSAALDGADVGVGEKILRVIRGAEELARRIQRRRLHAGMISLVLPEVEIDLDGEGRVAGARPGDTSFSHTIIEMFMVEANEAVARRLKRAGLTCLRRIHPPPAADDSPHLQALGPVLGMPPPARLTRAEIQKLLDAARGRPEERAVSYLLLRSLAQASYSPSDEGHFALASEDYCHFTSPIRRYPDLTVHRLVDLVLRGGADRPRKRETPPPGVLSDFELAELGREMTAAERRAQQAEREAQRALLVMLARRMLGQVCDGVITGVMSIGVFVQLDPQMIEGIVRVGDFGPDEWWHDRRTATFFGRGTGRVVHVGQRLRVMVAAVDVIRQQVTLVPADGGPIGRASGARGVSDRGRRRLAGRDPRGRRRR